MSLRVDVCKIVGDVYFCTIVVMVGMKKKINKITILIGLPYARGGNYITRCYVSTLFGDKLKRA